MDKKNKNEKTVSFFIKRLFDIVVCLISLIILVPIFIIIAVLIKLDSKGPVFFIQDRVGKDGKIFQIYKFRTMVSNAEKMGLGYVMKDDPRITRIGKYLRLTGVDELPQVFNVLRGEMSLVGPRPTLVYQVEKYSSWERRRLEMKPGITSLMLISGHNTLTWPERIKNDIWYIDHWSFWLDIKILIKTFWIINFTRKGFYENPSNFDFSEKKDKDS